MAASVDSALANDIVSVSARLLDMGDIHLSDHVVTPLFSPQPVATALRPATVHTARLAGRWCVSVSQGAWPIVHRVWRRGATTVLEVLRADGRVETCRLEQIDSYYPVEALILRCPLASNPSLLLGQRATVAGRRPNRGLLVDVEGTRLRGRAVIQLDGGKLLPCAMRRLRSIRTYSQAVIEPLIAQLRDVARTPHAALWASARA